MFSSLPFIYLFALCHCSCVFMSPPSVIIIGAGPAGIAAATKLLENSIPNITILEAEDRIGGRIHSVKFGETYVDVGAEYCHGEKGNIVYQLAKDFDVLEKQIEWSEKNVYYSNGSTLDLDFIKEIGMVASEVKDASDEDYDITGKSLGDFLTHRYNSTVFRKYQNNPEKLKLLKEGLRFAEGFVITVEGTFSWHDSSADSDHQVCEGDQNIVWKGCGYKTILEIMMKSYPDPKKKLPIDDKIYLRKKVTRVNWNESDMITVHTSDNAYSADYVIFTPSVGVLKEMHKTMFHPLLPISKQEAVEATGFAGVVKVLLCFSTKWWTPEDNEFSFFWSEEDLKAADFPHGPTKNGLSWVTQLREMVAAPNNPNVLVGWIGGDLVPEIEDMSLETLKHGCAYVMNKFLGRAYNLTEITKIMRSTWYSNENFRGTYSFTKTGLYKKDLSYQEELGKPLNNIGGKPALLFAGEATSPVHYSTVHGAIESGYREAERIIKLTSTAS